MLTYWIFVSIEFAAKFVLMFLYSFLTKVPTDVPLVLLLRKIEKELSGTIFC